MKIQLKQEKEYPEEGVELNMFTIIVSPENEGDKKKFNELEADFHFENFFDKEGNLRIIF